MSRIPRKVFRKLIMNFSDSVSLVVNNIGGNFRILATKIALGDLWDIGARSVCRQKGMLLTKMAKSVINISKMSPTHFVSTIVSNIDKVFKALILVQNMVFQNFRIPYTVEKLF